MVDVDGDATDLDDDGVDVDDDVVDKGRLDDCVGSLKWLLLCKVSAPSVNETHSTKLASYDKLGFPVPTLLIAAELCCCLTLQRLFH